MFCGCVRIFSADIANVLDWNHKANHFQHMDIGQNYQPVDSLEMALG